MDEHKNPRLVEIWKANMNSGIWVANKKARELMNEGVMPPETGSVALLSAPTETRLSTLMAPVNVIVGSEQQLAADMESVFERFADKLRPGTATACLTFVTGPSRTTDIEKTLIFGVHGPKKLVFVFAGDGS